MTSYDPVKTVLDRLDNVRQHDGNYTARCPLHDDHTNSLSITTGREGQALLYCHAGCETPEIVAAIDLEMRDLFPQQAGNPIPLRPATPRTGDSGANTGQRRIDAVYDYRDERGALRYQVVRFVPKGFAQRRPDGTGGYVWNLDQVQRVLYALPELTAADAHSIVFICEGEKDADLLRSLGLIATTNVGGAGKWRPEYSASLRGRQIVVLPDNDRAGADHARQVAESLAGIAASVKILTLPDLPTKGDVSDWFSLSGTVDRLVALAEATPPYRQDDEKLPVPSAEWSPRIIRLADVTPERVCWLWNGYIPLGKVSVIDGDPGLGKSGLTLDLAARVSVGAPMPDGVRSDLDGPAGVVILSAEDGLADTIRPRLDAMGADVSRIVALEAVVGGGKERGVTLADLSAIEAAITEVNARYVIVDPLMAYLGGETNAHRDQDVRGILAPLAKLAERTGVAIVVVRHLSKGAQANVLYRGGGSIGIIGAVRVALMVGRDPEDPEGPRRILAVSKSNLATFPPAMAYHMTEAENGVAQIVWEGATHHTAAAISAAVQPEGEGERSALSEAMEVLRTILASGPMPAKEAEREAMLAGCAQITIRRARKALGIKTARAGFGPGATWMWALPDVPPEGHEPPIDAQNPHRCSSENSEHLWHPMNIYGATDSSDEPDEQPADDLDLLWGFVSGARANPPRYTSVPEPVRQAAMRVGFSMDAFAPVERTATALAAHLDAHEEAMVARLATLDDAEGVDPGDAPWPGARLQRGRQSALFDTPEAAG
jgi:hypothetical protein